MSQPIKRLRHPYHLKKLYSSWRFRVLAPEHTGKRVHHQHTSYALLALLLLATTAVLTQSTLSTYALQSGGTKTISAVVSGPAPTQKATITSPLDSASFAQAPVTVTGTCELGSYQQLFRNDYPSGTAQCSTSGDYSIQTDLFSGTNDLKVRSYNLGGVAGPDSDIVHVTYTPPADPQTPPVQGSSSSTNPSTSGSGNGTTDSGSTPESVTPAEPLTLRNDYVIRGYALGQEASWQVSLKGGTAPYSVSVHWGDGTTALYTSKTADILTLSHVYTKPAPNDGYSIIVNIVDSVGAKTTLQILALITDTANAAKSSTAAVSNNLFTTLADSGGGIGHIIGILWTTVGAAALVLLAFWLGEKRELRIIKSRFRLSKL